MLPSLASVSSKAQEVACSAEYSTETLFGSLEFSVQLSSLQILSCTLQLHWAFQILSSVSSIQRMHWDLPGFLLLVPWCGNSRQELLAILKLILFDSCLSGIIALFCLMLTVLKSIALYILPAFVSLFVCLSLVGGLIWSLLLHLF